MRTIHLRFAAGLLLALGLIGIGVFFVHQFQLGRISSDLRAQVADARNAGKIDDAIRIAYQYLEFCPQDADMLVELASWLEGRGVNRRQLAYVAAMLDRALQIDPSRSALRRRVVAMELRLGHWSECLDHLERLLPEAPNDPELLANLGICQEAIARPNEAAASFAKSLAADPKRVPTSIAFAGLLQRHLHRPDDARRVLEECVQRSPESVEARLGLARFYRSIGRHSEATASAKEAVRLAPEDYVALTTAADIEQAAGRFAAARTFIEKARVQRPTDVRLACTMAWLLLCEGKAAEATTQLEAVLKDHPDDADALTLLGDILALDGRIDALERIVNELHRLRQGDAARGWNADYLKARLLIRRSDYAAAAKLLEELRLSSARRPGLAKQANYLQAQCYEQLHDRPKELLAYRRILDADAQAGYFRLEYARALSRAGDFPEAVKVYRQALQKTDLPIRTVLESAGEIADRCRRYGGEAALKDLERGLDPVRAEDANTYAVLAKIELLHRRQKTGDALRLTQQYLNRHANQVEVIALHIRLLDAFYGPERAAAALVEVEKRLGDQAEFRVARLRLLATRPQGAGQSAFAVAADIEKFNPEDRSRILNELITACGSNGEPATLATALECLRRSRPDHVASRTALLTHALATSDGPAIDALCAEIAAIEGKDGKAQRLFALEKLIAQNDLPSLRAQVESLLQSYPGDPIVLFFAGRADELQQQPATALRHYNQALESGLLDLPVDMLLVSLAAGEPSQRRISVFLEQSQLFDRLRLDLDRTLIRNLLPAAAASSRAAIADRLIHGNASASAPELIWLARLFQQQELSRAAEATLARATAVAPLSDEAWASRFSFHASRQDQATVNELVSQAKRAMPGNEAALILARALDAAGLGREALGQVQAAVAQEPSNVHARQRLIQQLSHTGRLAEARQQLQAMVEQQGLSPTDAAWARRTLAVNLTASPSLASFEQSMQLLADDRGQDRDDILRAKASVLAAQRIRPFQGKTARQAAIACLADIKSPQIDDLILLARLYSYEGDTANYERVVNHLGRDAGNAYETQQFLATEALRRLSPAAAEQHIAAMQRLDANRLETLVAVCTQMCLQGQSAAAISRMDQYIREAATGVPRAARQVRCGHMIVQMLANFPLAEQPAAVTALRSAAIDWYRAGLGRDPQALLQLMQLMCKAGRTTEAIEWLQSGLVRSSFSVEAQAAGLAIAARNGDANAQQLQTMERQLKAWLQKQPSSTALQLALADLYEAQNQAPKAVYIYQEILQREPTNLMAMNNLAWTSAKETGKVGVAWQLIQNAIDTHGQLDELLDTRGRLAFAGGRHDDGIRDMMEAAQGSPSGQRYFHLAAMYHRLNQPQAAAESMRKARRYGLTPAEIPPAEAEEYRELIAQP